MTMPEPDEIEIELNPNFGREFRPAALARFDKVVDGLRVHAGYTEIAQLTYIMACFLRGARSGSGPDMLPIISSANEKERRKIKGFKVVPIKRKPFRKS